MEFKVGIAEGLELLLDKRKEASLDMDELRVSGYPTRAQTG